MLSAFEVPAALAGERIDRTVALLTSCSRAEASRLVAAGGVLVEGRAVRSGSRRMNLGERVEIEPGVGPDNEEARSEASPLPPLRLAYVDEDLLVVDKAAGVVVHPGAGHHGATLVSALAAEFPDLASTEGIGERERPGIVHRLDKDTSGLIVVARSPLAYASLTAQLASRTMGRTYRGLALGSFAADEGVVEAPIGRSRRDRTRMTVTHDGRPARTRYEVVARYTEPQESSLLRVSLDTGRTHQIRVHLTAIGHPVAGDARYGGGRAAIGLRRPFLHAEQLDLEHPRSGQRLQLSSSLPPELLAALERCR